MDFRSNFEGEVARFWAQSDQKLEFLPQQPSRWDLKGGGGHE